MRGTASPARRQLLPKSLMQRLALLTSGELLPVRKAGSGHPLRTGARLGTLLWFGLGALTSGAVGGVAFLGLQALAAGEMRIVDDTGVASAGLAEAPPATPKHEAQPDTFDIAVDRSERARAPLGLHVTGTEDTNIEIMLQGIPAAARLSRGERRDALTWVVKRADLDGLYLTLGDTTPDAFDVRIDVLAPAGVATLGSVVRVRLVDSASQKQATTTEDRAHDKKMATETSVAKLAAAPASSRTAGVGDEAKVARPAQPRAAPTVADASPRQTAPRPWPEGASALGAVQRDSERQVWWNMPPPHWSPFQDPAAQP